VSIRSKRRAPRELALGQSSRCNHGACAKGLEPSNAAGELLKSQGVGVLMGFADMLDALRRALPRVRRHASFFSWPDKAAAELGVVECLFEAMLQTCTAAYHSPRGSGENWPDVVAKNKDGRSIAIEVTELVDQAAARAMARREGEPVREGGRADQKWADEVTLARIQERVSEKDARSAGGTEMYAESVLVIHTDELYLSPAATIALVREHTFALPHGTLSRAFLLFSYQPTGRSQGRYPYVELNLMRTSEAP